MKAPRLFRAIAGVMLLSTFGETQRRPDLTGEWELVEALASGTGRGSPDAASEGPRRTTSTTLSGAPFNCGRACTIVHTGEALTIEHAQLFVDRSTDKGGPAPSVTIPLHGRRATVLDSFNAPNELLVSARWEGSTVRIDSGNGPLVRQQLLSVENGQLLVVSSVTLYGEPRGETTFRYQRK